MTAMVGVWRAVGERRDMRQLRGEDEQGMLIEKIVIEGY